MNKVQVDGDDASSYSFIGHYLCKFLPMISNSIEYDLCISFLIPHDFGLTKVRAKKRIAWIHTDYSRMFVNKEMELNVWKAYDAIASISNDVTSSFITKFPSLKQKIFPIENILPSEYVMNRADEFDASENMIGGVKLLSIGRFCAAKNYDNVPYIAKRIVESGIRDLRWYIIGYGGDEELIRRNIAENGMGEYVILLGKKENPYPYIKACDIYVQPSRYEGKSVTVREAQLLGKPVAVTAYPTASSQINDGIDGIIIPLDNEGCAQGLIDLIRDKHKQNLLATYCRSNDFSNASEINKIYNYLGL